MSSLKNKEFWFNETYTAITADFNCDMHMHNVYELLYFLKGDADYIVGNTLYHLQPHDLLLIRPSVYHCLKLLSPMPYHRIVINFTEENLENTALTVLSELQTHHRLSADSLVGRYYRNCVNIVERYTEADAYPCLLHHLNLIISELKYSDKLNGDTVLPSVIHPILSAIIAYIDDNTDIPIDVGKLSKEFFVSPSWIMHAFRKFLNISATEYISRKKVLHAQQLITSGIPPTVVAESCGYKNYSTFFTQYKKIVGNTPVKSKPAHPSSRA